MKQQYCVQSTISLFVAVSWPLLVWLWVCSAFCLCCCARRPDRLPSTPRECWHGAPGTQYVLKASPQYEFSPQVIQTLNLHVLLGWLRS